MSIKFKSTFEKNYFDSAPATIVHRGVDIDQYLGVSVPLSDDDIRNVCGAPSGSRISYDLVTRWGNTGADRPPAGIYFKVEHQTFIQGENCIGICFVAPSNQLLIYIKDIHFSAAAPAGMAAILVARIARFCLRFGISKIRLLAAGGRLWPNMRPGERWGGYYIWPRCGFDMPLLAQDVALLKEFPFYPEQVPPCPSVQNVIQLGGGLPWWQTCGTGWFMDFDCSNSSTPSLATLDSYLNHKGI